MEIYLEKPIPEVNFGVRIPPKQLTRLQSSAIITGYKGRQDQVDTPEFKQSIFGQFLKNLGIYEKEVINLF